MWIQHGILKSDIYNMNEKKFAMNITESFKVLVQHTETQAFSVQTDNQNWMSLIECVLFNDITLSLYFIFKSKLIQQTWLNSIKNNQTILQISDNDWTTNAIKLQWLEAFNLHTKTQTQGTHQLLVLNDHKSYVFTDFIQYCCDHSIVTLCFSSHSTHLLQSLNVEVFESLSKIYKKCVYTHLHYEIINVNKLNFLHYYQKIKLTAITTQNILSA